MGVVDVKKVRLLPTLTTLHAALVEAPQALELSLAIAKSPYHSVLRPGGVRSGQLHTMVSLP